MKKIICIICGGILSFWSLIFGIVGVIILTNSDVQQGKISGCIVSLIIGFLLGFGAWKLFCKVKKSHGQPVGIRSVKTYVPEPVPVITAIVQRQEIPQEVLSSMRTSYTGQQALNDMRIIDESLAIMEKTSDIDIFLSRYDTAMRCALTLLQAKKAGVPIAMSDDFYDSLVNMKSESLAAVLYRSFQKELSEINKLKTESGKLNRINGYQEKLKGMYEDVFEFVAEGAYNDVMQKLDFLKNNS